MGEFCSGEKEGVEREKENDGFWDGMGVSLIVCDAFPITSASFVVFDLYV